VVTRRAGRARRSGAAVGRHGRAPRRPGRGFL